jgi:hypothetical protein
MLDQIWDFAVKYLSGEFGKAAGTATGFLVIGWLTRDSALNALARVFRNKKRKIRARKWNTAFVQRGRVKTESAELRLIPLWKKYSGVITYDKPNNTSRYSFFGHFDEGFLTATYKSEEEGTNDYGTWTLKLNAEGTALVGAYVWIIKDGEIGHDFYQWTEGDLKSLTRSSKSDVQGVGVRAALPLPKGALLGELVGTIVLAPTQKSVTVDGEYLDPSDDCTLGYVNHSCEPNARFNGRLLFLTDSVAEGDEITVDYRKTEQIISSSFQCRCARCRKGQAVTIK